jgi:hypothetical protein
LVLAAIVFAIYFSRQPKEETYQMEIGLPKVMELTSPAFQNNQNILSKYTCDGENVNPPLKISGAPAGAKSLVLFLDDHDAAQGIFNHWLVWNITPSVALIGENSLPKGVVKGLNDFKERSYSGPCPPKGETHRYYFKVYALDRILKLGPNSKRKDLDKAMAGRVLAGAELTGFYQKNE